MTRMWFFCSACFLTALGLLGLAQTSHAQGRGFPADQHPSYSYPNRYPPPTSRSVPSSLVSSLNQLPASPDKSGDSIHPYSCQVRVQVAPNARVWFDDQETQQRGPDRLFHSPPMSQGLNYSYRITAQWTDGNGETIVQRKDVPVYAGQLVNVTFPATSTPARPNTYARMLELADRVPPTPASDLAWPDGSQPVQPFPVSAAYARMLELASRVPATAASDRAWPDGTQPVRPFPVSAAYARLLELADRVPPTPESEQASPDGSQPVRPFD